MRLDRRLLKLIGKIDLAIRTEPGSDILAMGLLLPRSCSNDELAKGDLYVGRTVHHGVL